MPPAAVAIASAPPGFLLVAVHLRVVSCWVAAYTLRITGWIWEWREREEGEEVKGEVGGWVRT